jgi:hypothetical protein
MYYYIYKISFVDGYYYYGMRTSAVLPERDTYWGSPSTNKAKWSTTMYSKRVLDAFWTWEECAAAEHRLIGDNYLNDPFCLNESNYGTGCPKTKATREKMSKAAKGKKKSPEHLEKIRLANKGQKRKPMSEETKRKISEAKKGKKFSEEHRKNIGKSKKGWKPTAEQRENMSKGMRGCKKGPMSEEHKRKISESIRKRNASKRVSTTANARRIAANRELNSDNNNS